MTGFGDGGAENIYITAENLGVPGQTNDGLGWYSHQLDSTLFFKRLKAGASVTLTETDNSIIVALAAGAGPGEANDGQNIGAGVGLFAMKSGLNLQFKSLVAGSNITLSSDGTTVTVNSASDVLNAANLGAGQGVFASKVAGILNLKSIKAGNNITVTATGTEITIDAPNLGTGTLNDGATLGTGFAVYAAKALDVLQFKSIIAGNNIAITADANHITLNAAGDITNAASLGVLGSPLFAYKSGNTLNFRKIIAGSNVAILEEANSLTVSTVSDISNANNTGTGTGVFGGKVAGVLNFKSLVEGQNIVLSTDGDTVTIEALGGGVINHGLSLGAGLPIFAQSNGDTLEFKSLVAGANITLTPSANSILLSAIGDINNAQNLGSTGARLYSNKAANTLQFRRITAGTNVTITENANDIVINSDQGAWGTVNEAANIGAGVGLFAQKLSDYLQFKTLQGGSNVNISSTATEVIITVPDVGEINTGANVGSGASVYKNKSGTVLQFKKLISGINMSVVENANDISINALNMVTTASNLGSGEILFQNKVGETLTFKTIKAGSNISLTSTANELTINAIGTGSGSINGVTNLGTGLGLYAQTNLDNLEFKTLAAGTNITLTEAIDGTITLNAAGDVTNGLNLGSSGSRVFVTKSANQLQFRRIVAGSGVTVTENTNDITITATGGGGSGSVNDGLSLGTGSAVYKGKVVDVLQFRSIVAGTNTTVTSDANSITINSASDVVGATNLGAGSGLYSAKSAGNLQFKSLIAGTNISLSADANTVTINSLTSGDVTGASNLGASGSSLFTSKLAGILQFRKLIAGSGVTVTENTNDVTISATSGGGTITTAANLGAGNGIYASNTPSTTLNFKSLVAGANTTITNDANTITIASASDVTGGTNLGASGSSLYSAKSAGLLQFRKIIGGTNVTVTQNTNDITISSTGGGSGTITGATNLGAGSGVFAQTNGANLEFKSLVAGANVTLTPNGTTITIAASSGGGGSSIETQLLSFDSGNISIRASGTAADLALVTATKDYSTASQSTLILNKPTSVVYHSVNVVFTAGETTGRTALGLNSPDCNNSGSLSAAIRPLAMKINASYGVGGTASTMSLISGTTYLVLITGYTAASEQKATFIF